MSRSSVSSEARESVRRIESAALHTRRGRHERRFSISMSKRRKQTHSRMFGVPGCDNESVPVRCGSPASVVELPLMVRGVKSMAWKRTLEETRRTCFRGCDDDDDGEGGSWSIMERGSS